MKKITIQGTFTGSVNNFAVLEVYRPNPKSYDFKTTHNNSFTKVIDDLEPDTDYIIDITGHTLGGKIDIKISGDFTQPNPIVDSYNNTDFQPSYAIHTTKLTSIIN